MYVEAKIVGNAMQKLLWRVVVEGVQHFPQPTVALQVRLLPGWATVAAWPAISLSTEASVDACSDFGASSSFQIVG